MLAATDGMRLPVGDVRRGRRRERGRMRSLQQRRQSRPRAAIKPVYIWGGIGQIGCDLFGPGDVACRGADINVPRTTFQEVYVGIWNGDDSSIPMPPAPARLTDVPSILPGRGPRTLPPTRLHWTGIITSDGQARAGRWALRVPVLIR